MAVESSDPERVAARIRSIVAAPGTRRFVEAYFDVDEPFAGATFDTVGTNDPFTLSVDDLFAATLLDVSVPPRLVRRALGPDADTVRSLLLDIDSAQPLWLATPETLEAAEALWSYFRGFVGVDWVIAGKLTARKRPHLVPVLDSVVVRELGLGTNDVWETLREVLADSELQRLIEELRPAWVDRRVTTLRLLDVAVWMTGSGSRHAKRVRRQRAEDLPTAP